MSILPDFRRGAVGKGIMSPFAVEANRRKQYLAEAAKAGGVPEGARMGGMRAADLAGQLNRANYINMVDQAGGLPAMASARRFLDRINTPAAPARPNAAMSALGRLAGNFTDETGGLRIIPGMLDTATAAQRGLQNAAISGVSAGARAIPGLVRNQARGAGRSANAGLSALRSIIGGLF